MSLKTPFTDAIAAPDLGGQGVTDRGTDPNISTAGSPGVQTVWPDDKYVVPTPGGQETANSVSGLPAQPSRFEPSTESVEIPSLKDRNPGTIDKR